MAAWAPRENNNPDETHFFFDLPETGIRQLVVILLFQRATKQK